jgi:hypothetical protein
MGRKGAAITMILLVCINHVPTFPSTRKEACRIEDLGDEWNNIDDDNHFRDVVLNNISA